MSGAFTDQPHTRWAMPMIITVIVTTVVAGLSAHAPHHQLPQLQPHLKLSQTGPQQLKPITISPSQLQLVGPVMH